MGGHVPRKISPEKVELTRVETSKVPWVDALKLIMGEKATLPQLPEEFDASSAEFWYLPKVRFGDKLKNEISLPSFLVSGLSDSFLWLSSFPARSIVHFDPTDNLFCQVLGSKNVTLYGPDQGEFLYASVVVEGKYRPSEFNADKGIYFDRSHGSRLPVNDNYENFPLFQKATPFWSGEIKAGEGLFIPPFWWHDVRCGKNDFNVSLNTWCDAFYGVHGDVEDNVISTLFQTYSKLYTNLENPAGRDAVCNILKFLINSNSPGHWGSFFGGTMK